MSVKIINMSDEKSIQQKYQNYLSFEKHPSFLSEAQQLANNSDELKERFIYDLEFGTGGLRGIIGAGSNRMNPYIVARSSQGLASYAKKTAGSSLSTVVSYDSRRYSRDFAIEAAKVFTANGIKTYLFEELSPVPMLSFAVRHYQAQFGVMITASHNPPEYNGYKVYWKDGAQVLPPHDHGIVHSIKETTQVAYMNPVEAQEHGLLIMIEDEIHAAYQDAIAPLIQRPQLIQEQKDFSIVYTPLHGSGLHPVQQALQRHGFSFHIVSTQTDPDGDFPTVSSPNPEDPKAMALAIELAREKSCALVLATDPDADRIGAAVLHQGEFSLLTGNQIGAILLDYLASRCTELQNLPLGSYFVNSIVSSTLHNKIAKSYGISDYRVLTGFKYIAEKIRTMEKSQQRSHFLFGCEESYGYLCTTVIRDKDAISTLLVLCECAVWNHSRGRTLIDYLEQIYQRFGYFQETQISAEFPGSRGKTLMQDLMMHLRKGKQDWCSKNIVRIVDYKSGKTFMDGQYEKNIDLPSSNVLEFTLEDDSVIIARPSGTEPKIKFYLLLKGDSRDLLDKTQQEIQQDIHNLLQKFQNK